MICEKILCRVSTRALGGDVADKRQFVVGFAEFVAKLQDMSWRPPSKSDVVDLEHAAKKLCGVVGGEAGLLAAQEGEVEH